MSTSAGGVADTFEDTLPNSLLVCSIVIPSNRAFLPAIHPGCCWFTASISACCSTGVAALTAEQKVAHSAQSSSSFGFIFKTQSPDRVFPMNCRRINSNAYSVTQMKVTQIQ